MSTRHGSNRRHRGADAEDAPSSSFLTQVQAVTAADELARLRRLPPAPARTEDDLWMFRSWMDDTPSRW